MRATKERMHAGGILAVERHLQSRVAETLEGLGLPGPLDRYTDSSLRVLADWVKVLCAVEAAWCAAARGHHDAAVLALRLSIAALDERMFGGIPLAAAFVAFCKRVAGPAGEAMPTPTECAALSAGLPSAVWLAPYIAATLSDVVTRAREAAAGAEGAALGTGAGDSNSCGLQRVDPGAWNAALRGTAPIPSAFTAPGAAAALAVISSIVARVSADDRRAENRGFRFAACGAGTFVGLLVGLAGSASVPPEDVVDATREPRAPSCGAAVVLEGLW